MVSMASAAPSQRAEGAAGNTGGGSDADSPTQWAYRRVGRREAPETIPSPELVALVERHAPGESGVWPTVTQ